MIGNRVRIIFSVGEDFHRPTVTGVLHKLDEAGAVIWRENDMPEARGNSFIPMHRIHEIVDLGRPA